ncbi:MAG: metallophosphoesterase family protein [Candidatus Hydrogenedentota bacterium]
MKRKDLRVRYAIISDIHGNLEALEVVLAYIDEQEISHTICLGDVVGYGASPDECVSLIRSRGIPTIMGNHDAVACGREEPWGFNELALSAVMWTSERLSPENIEWLKGLPPSLAYESFLAVHATPEESAWDYLFSWQETLPYIADLREKNYRVCFFGHTHCPGIFADDGLYALDEDSRFTLDPEKVYMINPGSVGQPRDENARASFGIFDTESEDYELVRLEYDVDLSAQRIRDAGLPGFLADRLQYGH